MDTRHPTLLSKKKNGQMDILVLYNKAQTTVQEQINQIKELISSKTSLSCQDISRYIIQESEIKNYDLIIFLGDTSLEPYLTEQLAKIKDHNYSFVPLIRIGPADRASMEKALKEGFDDYLPSDMSFRLPFYIKKWANPSYPIKIQSNDIQKNYRQQEKLKSLSEKMVGLGSTMHNISTGHTVWSENMYDLLGLSPNDTTPSPQNYMERIHPDDRQEALDLFNQIITGGDIQTIEGKHRIVTPEGEVKVIAVNLLIEYLNGKPHIIYSANQDISLRELELNQIIKSRLILEQAGRMSRLGVARYNATTKEVTWSPGIYNMLEIPKDSIKPSLDFVDYFLSEKGKELFWNEVKRYVDQIGLEDEYISPVFLPNKNKVIKIWAKSLKEGDEIVVYNVIQDITENYANQKRIKELNKQLEVAVNEKEEELEKAIFRIKKIFDNNIIGLAVLDHNHLFLEANHYLTELLECSKAEIMGRDCLDILSGESRIVFSQELQSLEEEGVENLTSEKQLITNKGKLIWVKLHLSKIMGKIPGKEISILLVENISVEKDLDRARQEVLAQLKESEQKYRLLSETSTDLISAHLPTGEYTFVSQACKPLLGYEKEELLGKNPFDFCHPQDLSEIKNRGYTSLLNKNSDHNSITYRFRKKDNSYSWINSKSRAITDEKGNIIAIHTYSRDISKLVEAEHNIKRALKKEKEINELRSQFVTTASHQFRTPLTSIKASAQYLKMVINMKKYEEIFHTIDKETDRLTSLMNDILTLGKIDAKRLVAKKELIDLYSLIQKVVEQNLRSENDNRKVVIHMQGKNVPVSLDPNLMEHAFGNLISNALKYSRNKPAPQILISYESNQISIKLQDFGRGIPESDKTNLFTAFYRGKNVEDIDGTGLGLVIAKQFIELNGGEISFLSELEKGTIFDLSFPI